MLRSSQRGFFTMLMEDPVFLIDELMSKKRTVVTLFLTSVYTSRSLLNALLGAGEVKKYLILMSVTLPSITEQYDLLFSTDRASFSRVAMTR